MGEPVQFGSDSGSSGGGDVIAFDQILQLEVVSYFFLLADWHLVDLVGVIWGGLSFWRIHRAVNEEKN